MVSFQWRIISAIWSLVPLHAQVTAALEGFVFDPSGAPISGVHVKITSETTDAAHEFLTGESGRFLGVALPSGAYRAEVSHPGFRREVRTGLALGAGRTARQDFRLQMGEVREAVAVVAETPLLSTSSANWGGSVEKVQLDQLPLKGRDLFDLAMMQPGVQLATTAARAMPLGLSLPIAADGMRPNMNSFRLDGLTINDATGSAPASAGGRLLGLETVEELHFVSSPFSAEYGWAAGAVVTAVSRSGGNLFHGGLYYYLRNSALDAKNFFDSPTEKIPPLRKNHFGGLFGGPLSRNRLFFLANIEVIRENTSRTFRPVTLSNNARRGILPAPGGSAVIPIDPSVRPYLQLYPLPNGRDFGDGSAEFITETLTNTREHFASGKVDFLATEKLRLTGRYTFDDGGTSAPEYFHIWNLTSVSRYQFAHAGLEHVMSPRTLQELRFGFSRVYNEEGFTEVKPLPAELAYIKGKTMGAMRVVGLDDISGTRDFNVRMRPRKNVLDDFQLNYQLSHIRGAHNLRGGASFSHVRFDQRADLNLNGLYEFGSIEELLRARSRLGEFMAPGSDTQRLWGLYQVSAFLQDEYQVRRGLTLSLGLRYEAQTTPEEADGKVSSLRDPLHDSQVTLGGPVYRNPSAFNLAPRVSLAWDVAGNGKTVIRAGAGLFYDFIGTREIMIAGVRMPPYYRRSVTRNPSFPDLLKASAATPPLDSPDTIDFYPDQPYVLKFRFALERRVSAQSILRLTYAGSRGIHLTGQLGEFNVTQPTVLADGTLYFPPDAPPRNPAFVRFKTRLTQFNSFYHGFMAEWRRRWHNNLRFQASYTFSKSIDETSNAIQRDFTATDLLPNVFNFRANRGPSDFDIRHAVTVNGSWLIPWRGGAATSRAFGGWEIHALMMARTGPPFSPSVGFDRANLTGGGQDLGQRPDFAGRPGTELVLGDPQKYFDPLPFSLPREGYLGNLGRNVIYGPGMLSMDLALHKSIWKTERHTAKLRIEAFNATNRPNFQIPSAFALFNSRGQRLGTAGRITQTSTASRQLQVALRWEF